MGTILYRLGRLLQLVGLLTLPIAIAGNLLPEDRIPEGKMLLLCGGGVVTFMVGYLLQNAGKKG